MLYGKQVIELMAAYPGRAWVMRQLINYINPSAGRVERLAMQRAVHRVMVCLQATGSVTITKPEKFGGQNRYSWKT